jgi:hypothetical protein
MDEPGTRWIDDGTSGYTSGSWQKIQHCPFNLHISRETLAESTHLMAIEQKELTFCFQQTLALLAARAARLTFLLPPAFVARS